MKSENYFLRSNQNFKTWLFQALFLIGLFASASLNAQVATYYIFSESSGSYTPITGGTVIATATDHTSSNDVSLDQGNYTGTIPFNFNFNGTTYTSFNVNANGYITFGATLPTTTANTAISATTAYNGAIAAMARDIWGVYGSVGTRTSGSPTITAVTDFSGLVVGKPIRGTGVAVGATVTAFNVGAGTITMSANATATSTATYIGWPLGQIRVETIGTGSNRVCVIQFSGMADWTTTAPSGHTMDFQIRLAEGGGVASNQSISIVYGPQTNLSTTSRTQQVGLRGATNTDFNNRTATTTWSPTNAGTLNSSTLTRTNLIFPANGLTFTWTPPNVCTGTPTAGTANTNSASICMNGTASMSLTGFTTGTTGITFQWQESNITGGPYTDVSTGTGGTTSNYTSAGLTANKFYVCKVTCTNSGLFAVSNQIAITVNNPLLTGTTGASLCGTGTVNLGATVSSGATANWYAASTGGTPLFTGTTFTTPTISSTTNYWVAAASGFSTFNTSKLAPEPASTGTVLSTYTQDFTVTTGFTLNSVQVVSTTGTSITVSLFSSGGTTQLFTTGAQAVVAGTSPTITCGWYIAPGTYRLATNGMTGNFIRDNTGVTYPFALSGGIGTMNGFTSAITGSVTTSSSYYFLYNWSVSTGCESARTMVTATVTSAPAITPSTTKSLVCSGGSTTLNVSSSNPGYTYTWMPGSLTGTSVNVSPASTTTYTVTALDNSGGSFQGCTTPSTVVITAQPSSVTVNASPEAICASSGSSTLSLTPASGYPVGSIQWQDSPNGSTYSDIGGATNNTYASPTLNSSTYYRALIKDGAGATCLQPSKQIVVGVPTLNSTTGNTRCGVGTTTLQATGSAGSTIKWYTASSGGTSIGSGSPFTTPVINTNTTYYASAETGSPVPSAQVGTGATTSATYSNPFYSLWSNTHNQHLLLASELTAAGLSAGSITAGGMNITVAGTLPMIDLSIKMANTTATNMSAYVSPVFTTVFTSASVMPIQGLNMISFTTPFIWDGVSNVVIEICHGNPSSTATMSRTASMDATAYVSSIHTHKTVVTSGTSQCSDNTTNLITYSTRPTFTFSQPGCSSSRTAVTATVTPAPAITISASTMAVCPGGTSDLSVSSVNDPNYTYSWTSSPAGFTASGVGPHTVSPSATTKYYVNAVDNTAGANQNCAAIDSVTILNDGTLTAGTLSAGIGSICLSGSTTLTLTGSAGGTRQWQMSTTSNTGPWTTVATGGSTLATGTITQTTYYRVNLVCNASSVQTNVVTVTVNTPTLASTTPNSRCGVGTVTLGATNPSGTVNWYTAASGGTPIHTGTSYTTPTISSTTTYYATPSTGGSTSTTGYSTITGATSGAGTTNFGIVFDALTSFTLNSVTIYPVAASANTSGTVTIDVIDANNNILNTATVNVLGNPAASPVAQIVPLNFVIAPGTNLKLRPGARSASITGLLFGPSAAAPVGGNYPFPYNISGTLNMLYSTLTAAPTNTARLDLYYYFYDWSVSTGCEGARVPVTATISAPSPITATSVDNFVCTGGSTTIAVSSPNDPNYTYTWSSVPAGFSASGNGPHTISPSVTTKYYVNALDNSGGASQGCTNIDSVTVGTGGVLNAGTIASSRASLCVTGTPVLTATGAAGGALQWQQSTVSATGPWTNVGTGIATYSPTISQTTYFQLVVSCQSSSLTSNTVTVTVDNPLVTSNTPATRCGTGTVTLGATASSGSTLNWYTASTGGSAIGTGTSFTTPILAATTNYYVGASSGLTNTNVSKVTYEAASSATNLTTYGQDFTVTVGFTLNNVQVFSTTGTSITIALYSSGGTTLLQTTGARAVTAATSPLINCGWYIAPGTYRLCATGMTGNFYRDNTVVTYPFALGTVGTMNGFVSAITGSVTTTSSYYFMYNWNISVGCESARTLVAATVTAAPAISVSPISKTVCNGEATNLQVSSGNGGYAYTWMPGNISGSNINVNPTTTGKYYVTATDAGSGCVMTDSIALTVMPAAPTVSSSPAAICVTGSATMALTPATGYPTGTIQWQTSANGLSYSDLVGATGTSYVTPVITSNTFYKALIKNGAGATCVEPFKEVEVNNPLVVSTMPKDRCGTGTIVLKATPSVGSSINWYQSATGGISIASGNNFTTPVIAGTTDYWAEATSGTTVLNGLGNTTLPTATGATAERGIVFTAYSNFTILSSQYYSPTLNVSNTFTVKLVNHATGVVLNTLVIPVAQGPTASWYTLNLNLPVQAGVTYRLLSAQTSSINRITSGVDYSSVAFNNLGSVGLITSGYDGSVTATAYNYFHNLSVNSSCVSPRTMVTATVTPAPAISVSPSTSICSGTSTIISASSVNLDYTYVWKTSAGVNVGTGDSRTVSPNSTTKYIVTATDPLGCSQIDSLTITVNPTPTKPSINVPSSSICNGASTTLSVTTPFLIDNGNVQVGSQTTTSITGSPFRAGAGTTLGNKVQYLYTASELSTAGLIAGQITSIGFLVTSTTGDGTVPNFEISMGQTSTSSFTTAFEITGLNTVYSAASYTPTLNAQNTFTLTTPFMWDGLSNVVINVCHGLVNPVGTSMNVSMGAITSRVIHYVNAATNCATSTTGTLGTIRPIITFGNSISATYTWSPSGTGTSLVVSPTSTTTYTVVGSVTLSGCTSQTSNPRTITVNNIPATPGAIIGNINVVQGSNQTYSVAPVSGANSYTWILPATWTGSSSTYVINSTAGTGSGNVEVVANNSCGSSVGSSTLAINMLPLVIAPSVVRSSDCGRTDFSLFPARQLNSYTVLEAVTGATDYEAEFSTDPGFATIDGSRKQGNRTIIFANVAGLTWNTVYYVRARAWVNTIQGPWGTTCQIGFVDNPLISGVPNAFLDPHSCGRKNVTVNSGMLAVYVPGANAYTFNFYDDSLLTNLYSSITYRGRNVRIASLVPGLLTCTTYWVTVQAIIGTVTGSASAACTIETACPPARGNNGELGITAFPNPSKDVFNVVINSTDIEKIQVRVLDALGRVMSTEQVSSNTLIAIGENLPAGYYLVEAVNSNGVRAVTKLVKAN